MCSPAALWQDLLLAAEDRYVARDVFARKKASAVLSMIEGKRLRPVSRPTEPNYFLNFFFFSSQLLTSRV